jgi:hypothetical protein
MARIRSEIITITPEMAALALGRTEQNRQIKKERIVMQCADYDDALCQSQRTTDLMNSVLLMIDEEAQPDEAISVILSSLAAATALLLLRHIDSPFDQMAHLGAAQSTTFAILRENHERSGRLVKVMSKVDLSSKERKAKKNKNKGGATGNNGDGNG